MENTQLKTSPTEESYTELETAYNYLNETLFNGELPPCLITFQRVNNVYGYHSGNRWVNRKGVKTDEIAMNPTYFATRSTKKTLSTLGHEMVHLWQLYFGKAGRGRYHNKQWAKKMREIGLQPFNTKNENRETGDQVSHTIIEKGRFDIAIDEFLSSGFTISWLDRAIKQTPETDRIINSNLSNVPNDEIEKAIEIIETEKGMEEITGVIISTGGKRTKYSCPQGHYSVWGKSNIDPICGQCKKYLLAEN